MRCKKTLVQRKFPEKTENLRKTWDYVKKEQAGKGREKGEKQTWITFARRRKPLKIHAFSPVENSVDNVNNSR